MKPPFRLPARIEDDHFLVAHDCELIADLHVSTRAEREFILKAVNNYRALLGALVEASAALEQMGCELGLMPELEAIIEEAT